MTKNGNGRMILIMGIAFILLLIIGLGMDAWGGFTKARNVQLIQTMNMTDNPEGPTLEECINSYYGERVSWVPLSDNMVQIQAYRDEESLDMTLQVNQETGNADLIDVLINHTYPTEEEFNRMVNAWIQAAQ